MQFVQHGPDIPDALLQAHEDGRVVFFCGAGISYPAGLKGFDWLVAELFSRAGERPDEIEAEVLKNKQFDQAVGRLENRIQGGRKAIRRSLPSLLHPDLTRTRALTTHLALLTLGRRPDGEFRLVTTNFDALFQTAAEQYSLPSFTIYPDVPARSSWEGLVYLHGRVQETSGADELDRLILSDGDFGQAYLTQGWAARFINSLYQNFTVCFVGYSIDDPVLRYMTAAHALTNGRSQMYAFAPFTPGLEATSEKVWRAKSVIPILYEDSNHHRELHRTLHLWASVYRDRTRGKERVVVRTLRRRPEKNSSQDDFVGRMLWALSHDSGLPAKRFADFDPAPSLDWLGPLSDERFKQADLPRFGVAPLRKQDDQLAFGLTRRPAPYNHAPWMMLTAGNVSTWDTVMFHLARWLIRHLNDPELVLWLAKRGGQLHDRLVWLIESELDRFARLERAGNTAELARIRANSPNAIPSTIMRTVWRLLLTDRVKSPWRDHDLYRWKDRFKRDGMTTTLRLDLRALLMPMITLKKPFRWGEDNAQASEPSRVKDLLDWELVLAADHVHSSLTELAQSETWRTALPALLDDVQQLLRDALDLMRELDEADDQSDRGNWDLPSISPHWQNRGFHDWTALIELLRDAWLCALQNQPMQAMRIAHDWITRPYPTFKRLALFAAMHDGITPQGEWVDWLLADTCWWLWSIDTKRETMRLLVLRGQSLPADVLERLEASILAGPPRQMYRADIEAERWQELVDHSVWLHLAKLASGGRILGDEASSKLAALSAAHANWQLEANESDEFSHWMSGTGDPDYQDRFELDRAPRSRRELVIWLQRQAVRGPFYEDDWSDLCRDKFSTAACALYALATENQWPAERWRAALQAWSEEKQTKRSWRYLSSWLMKMPDDVLTTIAHSATWWLEAISKLAIEEEPNFIDLCRRFLTLALQDGVVEDHPVARAINHPIGHITQALLNRWIQRQPNDEDGLPEDLKPLFSLLCDTQVAQYRHARVLLASRLITLFRVDRSWTEQYLLPLFNWQFAENEVRGAWDGFLWSPRLYRPLLASFKANFLETARHYADLGDHAHQYAAILTHAAMDPAETFTTAELYSATSALPQEGLVEAAQALVNALEGSGEQREAHWNNRIQPYWRTVWPKSRQLASKPITEQLARLAIAARDEFPAALATVRDWLQPLEHPGYTVHLLLQSALCTKFPLEALTLLDKTIDDQPWPPSDLEDCLIAIIQSWPEAQQDSRYQRLLEYQRRR